MAAPKRSLVTLCAVVAWLTTGPPPKALGRRLGAGRLTVRLWRRRLSLFGLLLLTLGGRWMESGAMVRGGWESRIVQTVVWLEVMLMGVLLVCMDLDELVQRALRRQAVEPQHGSERRPR
jgi:hypothetical protein